MNAFNKNLYVVFLLIFQKLMKTATMRVQFIIFLTIHVCMTLTLLCFMDPVSLLQVGKIVKAKGEVVVVSEVVLAVVFVVVSMMVGFWNKLN